jgi:hypothetical protein
MREQFAAVPSNSIMSELKDIYISCPEHPEADIRLEPVPTRNARGQHETVFIAVCSKCNKTLPKKPVTTSK